MEIQNFVDRESQFKNRRRLEIVSQTPNQIIADIYREEGNVDIEGTPITAKTLNDFKAELASWEEQVKNSGTVTYIGEEKVGEINFTSDPQSQIYAKIDKVPSSIVGNIASFVSGGNIQDSGLIAEKIEQVETLYDMSSADSSVNWGYTSGIQNSVTATLPDYLKGLTKYKKIIVYYQRQGSAQPAVIMDLTRTNVAEYQAWVPVYYGTWYSSNGRLQIVVNKEKTTIKFTYLDNTNNTISQNSNNFIFKIEGIY